MPARYDLHCPVARTLDIVGERWTMLILRDLLTGPPQKFQDLERSLGINPNTLSARLKRLEQHGIIERRFYEQHPPRADYVLTDKGRQLGPVLRALLDWGRRHTTPPEPPPDSGKGGRRRASTRSGSGSRAGVR